MSAAVIGVASTSLFAGTLYDSASSQTDATAGDDGQSGGTTVRGTSPSLGPDSARSVMIFLAAAIVLFADVAGTVAANMNMPPRAYSSLRTREVVESSGTAFCQRIFAIWARCDAARASGSERDRPRTASR